jgi:hypothetical protein
MIHTAAAEFFPSLEKFTSVIHAYRASDLFQSRLATRSQQRKLGGLLVCRGCSS